MDGGFVIKKLMTRNNGAFPDVRDIEAEAQRIENNAALAGMSLLRVYFYDAHPASKKLKNPIDQSVVNLAGSHVHSRNVSLHQALELRPNFALRMGEAVVHGWQLGKYALNSISAKPRALTASDLVPNIEQKGVDLRIGLDIARLSLRGLVRVIVLVSGDSDFIPAMKFARREGIRVYLDHMGHGVRRDLKVHADLIL